MAIRLLGAFARWLAAGAMVVGSLGGASAAAAATSSGEAPKVVVIVGPVGSLTDYYRGLAAEAIAEGRRDGAHVVAVMSPDATWPAVRQALQGASIVVYLGHGNGHPSPYRPNLYRPTQDGLGLNPVAGAGDVAHQYFGEQYLADRVALAPGAVVILSHLCYASGNPEPGGPEPTLTTAESRVDNYAAGWLAAGAGAVIAEGHLGPAYYVRSLIARRQSAGAAWLRSPTFHDHVINFPSRRTASASDAIDPDVRGAGYYRSLVVAPGAHPLPRLPSGGGSGSRDGSPGAAIERASSALAGVTFGSPAFAGSPVAGTTVGMTFPISLSKGGHLPKDLLVGERWTLVVPDSSIASQADTGGPPDRAAAVSPADPTPAPSAAANLSHTPEPDPSPAAPPGDRAETADPPAVDLIAAETPGLITTFRTTLRARQLRVAVAMPSVAGHYRLSLTLHTGDGVALDADAQALVPSLIVHVVGELSAAYAAAPSAAAIVGRAFDLPVRVTNTGTGSWSRSSPIWDPLTPVQATGEPRLVGSWVALDAADGRDGATDVPAPATRTIQLGPGSSIVTDLPLTAPTTPGSYLVVLDVVLPGLGSLAAAGVPIGVVLVAVKAEPASGYCWLPKGVTIGSPAPVREVCPS